MPHSTRRGVFSLACLIACLVWILPPTLTMGQETTIQSARPGFTEGAMAVGAWHFTFEGGFQYARVDRVDYNTFGELLVRFGVGDRLELRTKLNSLVFVDHPVNESGYVGPSIGTKVGLLCPTDPACPSRLSVVAMLDLPITTGVFATPDHDIQTPDLRVRPPEDHAQQEVRLLFEQALAERFTFLANAGVRFIYADDRAEEWIATTRVRADLGERTSVFVGYAGFYGPESPNATYLETGATFLESPRTQFDVNAGLQVDANRRNFFIGAGFARKL